MVISRELTLCSQVTVCFQRDSWRRSSGLRQVPCGRSRCCPGSYDKPANSPIMTKRHVHQYHSRYFLNYLPSYLFWQAHRLKRGKACCPTKVPLGCVFKCEGIHRRSLQRRTTVPKAFHYKGNIIDGTWANQVRLCTLPGSPTAFRWAI